MKRNTNIGNIPPQNIEAEEAVLGAVLLEKNAIVTVMNILDHNSFYNDKHARVYSAALDLYRDGSSIDLLTVTSYLRKKSELDVIGGAMFLAELTEKVGSAANVEHHARLIQEASYKRSIIKMCSDMVRRSYDPFEDIHTLNQDLQSGVLECTQGIFKKKGKTLKELITSSLAQTEAAMKNKKENKMTGIPSGLRDVDLLTGGWQRGNLIIIAARPSMGKSALAATLAKNAYKLADAVGIIFSLEMTGEQNLNRMISEDANVKYSNMAKGELNELDFINLQESAMNIYTDNILIDDSSTTSVLEMKAKATNLKLEKGRLDFIMLDYIQLVKGLSKGNREQEIAGISRALKEAAKDLDVPVIALAQLSRSVEQRGGDKRPMLSDLRESGSIEQDADMVIFLFRPEYYGIEVGEDNEPTTNLCELIFAKHRNGRCTPVKTYVDLPYNKFSDWNSGNAF